MHGKTNLYWSTEDLKKSKLNRSSIFLLSSPPFGRNYSGKAQLDFFGATHFHKKTKSNSPLHCSEFQIAEIYLLCASPGLQNEKTQKLNLQPEFGVEKKDCPSDFMNQIILVECTSCIEESYMLKHYINNFSQLLVFRHCKQILLQSLATAGCSQNPYQDADSIFCRAGNPQA